MNAPSVNPTSRRQIFAAMSTTSPPAIPALASAAISHASARPTCPNGPAGARIGRRTIPPPGCRPPDGQGGMSGMAGD